MAWSLSSVFARLGSWPYDRMYRRGAPWEGEPRRELVALVESGRLDPDALGGARAFDIGCGSGADSIFLADHGFDVTGVDFSAVALDKAHAAAGEHRRVRFVQADLLALPAEVTAQPYDLLFDGGTLDDFSAGRRRDLAAVITGLSRPGSVLVWWCFYAAWSDLPWLSFDGPSRRGGQSVQPGEEQALFGADWHIERLPEPADTEPFACFWLTRR